LAPECELSRPHREEISQPQNSRQIRGGAMMRNPANRLLALVIAFSALFLMGVGFTISEVFAVAHGTVKSKDGQAIEGARIILIFSEDGAKHELLSDKKGRWRKANLPPGAYTIGFMADGFEPQNIKVTLSAIRENEPVDIRLVPIPVSPLSQGDLLYGQQKYQEALQEYQRVLSENQTLDEACDRIGLCYYRLGDLDKAIEVFQKALEKDPQSQAVLINLSSIFFEKGQLEEGLKYFNQLEEKSLTNPNLFYNVGVLLFKNNQMELAAGYFKKTLELDANFINGYYQLGLVNLNRGDTEEAKRNFEKVIELAPESEKAALSKKMLENIK
jgi:Flp pilus assembly protein TadD